MLHSFVNERVLCLRLHHSGALFAQQLQCALDVDFAVEPGLLDVIDEHVDSDVSASPSDASRTVHNDRTGLPNALLTRIDVLLKVQYAGGVLGHVMVGPHGEMVMKHLSRAFMTAFLGHSQLTQDVRHALSLVHMDDRDRARGGGKLTFTFFRGWPVPHALVLQEEKMGRMWGGEGEGRRAEAGAAFGR